MFSQLSNRRGKPPPHNVNRCTLAFTLCIWSGIILLGTGCYLCEYAIVKPFRFLTQGHHKTRNRARPTWVAEQELASEADHSSVGSGSLTLRDENDSSLSMDSRDMSQEYFEKCRTIM